MSNIREELSDRELEILRLVATGASNKEIASRLFISTNTVKVHIRNIFSKIEVTSRTEAAVYALHAGLVVESPDATIRVGANEQNLLDLQDSTVPQQKEHRPLRWWIVFIGITAVIIAFILIFFWFLKQEHIKNAAPTVQSQTVSWQTLKPMPTARSGLATVAYDGWVYAIGGETPQGVTGVLEAFNPSMNFWREGSPKPTPVQDIGSVVIGGKIYIPGGRTASGAVTDILEIYNPREDSWVKGAPIPVPLCAYGLAALDGRIYLFGGWDGSSYQSTVYRYIPEEDTWNELLPMPTPRAYMGAAVVGSKIIVIGGKNDERNALKENEVFSPDLTNDPVGPWRVGTPMPYGLSAMGVASVADVVYVIGGVGELDREYPILLYYDQVAEWQVAQAESVEFGSNLGLSNLGQYLYAMGGKATEFPLRQNLGYQAVYTISFPFVIK